MEGKTSIGVSINIILLGIVSFFTDVSSEMITPILPMLIIILGGNALIIGLIGGLSDSITSILQVYSGHWSDRYGKRKPFIYSGYIISAISKLFLPLSTMWQHLLVIRPLERVGKGIRTAPRDAVIADSVVSEVRGKAFGFHRAFDTSGAILGSILALILYGLLGLEFTPILWISAIVAFLALPPIFFVREEARKQQRLTLKISLTVLPKRLRLFVLIATIFALGNFTYMFFVTRAQEIFAQLFAEKMAKAIQILLYVLFNIIYTIFSIPSGILSDKIGRKNVLLLGYLLFGVTCLGFALVPSLTSFLILFCLYGLVYALVDGTQRAFASDLSSEELKGTALGTFHTSIGLATLPASLIAGILWQHIGPSATFIYGSILGFTASMLLGICIK